MKRLEPIIVTGREWCEAQGGWPWQILGIFPSLDDVETGRARAESHFMYTTGVNPLYDVWMPMASVEGRMLDFQLGAVLVNGLAFGTLDATIRPGEDVKCAVGIPNADGEWDHDADIVFWIGRMEINDHRRQTFQTAAPRILPILWSSPLGWKDT